MLDVLALLPFIVTATAALSATAPRVQLTFSPAHAIHEGTVGTLASRSISQAGQAPSHTAVVWATPTRVRTRSKQRSPWDETDILAPDVTDLDTLTELSRLASNAYNEPGSKSWYDVPGWNNTLPIGTEDPSGMRGHLFASSDNSTIVLAVKGTNLPFSGPTSGRDKQNDNTMFSCCCAHSACSCASRGNKCDTACLETALAEESMFYNFGINLYNNVTYLYPDATVWIVGHSLGGALAALLSATFGAPTVTFSSPGERRAARLLHLPQSAPVTHVIHTADPVSYGTCVTCARAGYSLETRCHLGRVIEFDTQSRFGWRGDIRHHPLSVMINKVLGAGGLWPDPHNPGNDTGSTWVTVPDAREQLDCQDCYKWTYDDDRSLLRMQTSHMQT